MFTTTRTEQAISNQLTLMNIIYYNPYNPHLPPTTAAAALHPKQESAQVSLNHPPPIKNHPAEAPPPSVEKDNMAHDKDSSGTPAFDQGAEDDAGRTIVFF